MGAPRAGAGNAGFATRLTLFLLCLVFVLMLLAQHGPRCGAGEQRSVTVGNTILVAGCRQ